MSEQSDIILGVDPGVTGALATFIDGTLFYVDDLPTVEVLKKKKGAAVLDLVGGSTKPGKRHYLDTEALRELLKLRVRGRPALLINEKVSTRHGQGTVTNAALVKAASEIKGIAIGMGIQYIEVSPQEWQRKTGGCADPGLMRQRAAELFPHMADEFRRSKDHNRADAAFIGWYGVKCIP